MVNSTNREEFSTDLERRERDKFECYKVNVQNIEKGEFQNKKYRKWLTEGREVGVRRALIRKSFLITRVNSCSAERFFPDN